MKLYRAALVVLALACVSMAQDTLTLIPLAGSNTFTCGTYTTGAYYTFNGNDNDDRTPETFSAVCIANIVAGSLDGTCAHFNPKGAWTAFGGDAYQEKYYPGSGACQQDSTVWAWTITTPDGSSKTIDVTVLSTTTGAEGLVVIPDDNTTTMHCGDLRRVVSILNQGTGDTTAGTWAGYALSGTGLPIGAMSGGGDIDHYSYTPPTTTACNAIGNGSELIHWEYTANSGSIAAWNINLVNP